jgi:curved DNA-binding protein CbpA
VGVTDPYKALQVLPTADQEVIRAAFRALAMKYHPDRDPSALAAKRMIELNRAFALVRTVEARAKFDRGQARSTYDFDPARSAKTTPPPRSDRAGVRLQEGRYAGWTLRDLAKHDPDYLRWLSRHASGLRYRAEIKTILAAKGAEAA